MTSTDRAPTGDAPSRTTASGTAPSGTAHSRSARLLHEAGQIVAGWPQVRHRLAAAHRPDAGGRCRACGTQNRPAPVWPCTLAVLVRAGEDHAPAATAPTDEPDPHRP